MSIDSIPLFDEVLEIDEVLDSCAWDLCGYRKRSGTVWRAAAFDKHSRSRQGMCFR